MRQSLEWAREEFGAADLGDVRRRRRLIEIAAAYVERPGGKVTEVMSCTAEREGAFRFVENESISPAAIAEGHHAATARRCRSVPEVLVAVDQSTLTLTDRVGKTGFGRVGSVGSQYTGGFEAMTALAVTPDGVTQGVLAQHWWSRTEKSPEWKGDLRPPEERESDLWRRALTTSHDTLRCHAPRTVPWFQVDRGADSAAVLRLARDKQLKITVRSAYDRRLANGGYLHQSLRRRRVLGHLRVRIPARTDRPSRDAHLSIRMAAVKLLLRDVRGRKLGIAEMVCVYVRERRAPRHGEAIEWWLLTTAPVTCIEDALLVVANYRHRWKIEEFHKAWKSGVCRIEDSQLRTAGNFQRWATIAVAVAARAERLKTSSRAAPDVSARSELSRSEIDASIILSRTKKHVVGDDLTLGEVTDLIARIGGYIGKSSGGPPGVRVLQRGLERVLPAAQAIEALRKSD